MALLNAQRKTFAILKVAQGALQREVAGCVVRLESEVVAFEREVGAATQQDKGEGAAAAAAAAGLPHPEDAGRILHNCAVIAEEVVLRSPPHTFHHAAGRSVFRRAANIFLPSVASGVVQCPQEESRVRRYVWLEVQEAQTELSLTHHLKLSRVSRKANSKANRKGMAALEGTHLLSVDGHTVKTLKDVLTICRKKQPGDRVKLGFGSPSAATLPAKSVALTLRSVALMVTPPELPSTITLPHPLFTTLSDTQQEGAIVREAAVVLKNAWRVGTLSGCPEDITMCVSACIKLRFPLSEVEWLFDALMAGPCDFTSLCRALRGAVRINLPKGKLRTLFIAASRQTPPSISLENHATLLWCLYKSKVYDTTLLASLRLCMHSSPLNTMRFGAGLTMKTAIPIVTYLNSTITSCTELGDVESVQTLFKHATVLFVRKARDDIELRRHSNFQSLVATMLWAAAECAEMEDDSKGEKIPLLPVPAWVLRESKHSGNYGGLSVLTRIMRSTARLDHSDHIILHISCLQNHLSEMKHPFPEDAVRNVIRGLSASLHFCGRLRAAPETLFDSTILNTFYDTASASMPSLSIKEMVRLGYCAAELLLTNVRFFEELTKRIVKERGSVRASEAIEVFHSLAKLGARVVHPVLQETLVEAVVGGSQDIGMQEVTLLLAAVAELSLRNGTLNEAVETRLREKGRTATVTQAASMLASLKTLHLSTDVVTNALHNIKAKHFDSDTQGIYGMRNSLRLSERK